MIIIRIFIDGHDVGEYRSVYARNAINIMHCLSDVFNANFSVYEEVDEEDFVNEDSEE